MTVSGTPGTGTISLSAAVSGFQTFAAAGVGNGNFVSYVIEDGTNWEFGRGIYTTSGTTLARTIVIGSSAGGTTKISATSAAVVYCSALASDFLPISMPASYGAIGDGTTNDTVAIQAFLTSLQDGGLGYWGNASYLVDEGTLLLQPSSSVADTIGPTILGHATFIASGHADAPILQIKNPDETGTFAFYRNGDMGQISFIDGVGSGVARHGVEISGLFNWKGTIEGTNLHGAVIHVPLRVTPGISDNYEVFGCSFAVTNKGSTNAVLNENFVDGAVSLSYLNTVSGSHGYQSSGAQVLKLSNLSIGTNSGYGLYFLAGQTGNRVTIDGGELDTCALGGLYVDAMTDFNIRNLRITMRNGAETGNVTWPANGMIIIGSSGIVSDGYIDAICRFSDGITLLNIAPAIDCTSSSGIVNLTVNLTISDQTTGGVLPTDTVGLGNLLVKNVRDGQLIDIFINGLPYIQQRTQNLLVSSIPDMTVTATANTNFTLSIPPRMTLAEVTVFTTIAFGAATDATMQIGSSVGASDYVAAQSIKSLTTHTLAITPSSSSVYMSAADPNLFIRITQTGTTSATGRCTLVVKYIYTNA